MKKMKAFALEAIAQMAKLSVIQKPERWRLDRARARPVVNSTKKSGYGTPGLGSWVCLKSLYVLPSLLF